MEDKIVLELPKKVKILGISGSPRKEGATAQMVRYCLEWAEKMGYVETEYLSLANYKLYPCTGCLKCFGFMAPDDDPYMCYEHPDDDIKVLAPKVAECDGLLIGFPVYVRGLPSLYRMFEEKLQHFGAFTFSKHAMSTRYKAIGIISQGGAVYGGQESCYNQVVCEFAGRGWLVASGWPTREAPMPTTIGCLTTAHGTSIYGKNAWRKEATRTVPPALGSQNERTLKNLGRWLAVAAMHMKLARTAFRQAGYAEPEIIPFTQYSVKPKPGSYVDKLMKEGKVTFVPPEEIEARKTAKR